MYTCSTACGVFFVTMYTCRKSSGVHFLRHGYLKHIQRCMFTAPCILAAHLVVYIFTRNGNLKPILWCGFPTPCILATHTVGYTYCTMYTCSTSSVSRVYFQHHRKLQDIQWCIPKGHPPQGPGPMSPE